MPRGTHRRFTLTAVLSTAVLLAASASVVVMFFQLSEAARLQDATVQLKRYVSAVDEFFSKYGGLPGDLPRAHDYGLGKNGNGNGLLEDGDDEPSYLFQGEIPEFWQQLGGANLIEGRYNGENILGEGFPRTPFKEIGLHVYSAEKRFYFQIGAISNAENAELAFANYITPEHSYIIDAKMDDATATTGLIVARGGNRANQPASTGPTGCLTEESTYNTAFKDRACQLRFRAITP